MSRTTLHRTRILCLAGALSLLPWHGAQALPRRAAPATRTPVARLADGLSSLGQAAWVFFIGKLDNGCSMDPDGCNKLEFDNGCKMDPSGYCVPQVILQSDNGCQMDPSGKPIPGTCSGIR